MNKQTLWDTYFESFKDFPEISQELRDQVGEAYSFLRKEFGERFLINGVKGHALKNKILQKAPWQLEDLVNNVNILKRLKEGDSNYDLLLEKLRSRDKSQSEGIPILELSRMLLNVGLTVKIEPTVPNIKKPDLEIVNPENGDVIFGELSIINESDDRNVKRDDHFLLFEIIEIKPPYVHYGCRQKARLKRDELDQLEEFIDRCKASVIANNSFEVFENDFIVIGFASADKLELLNVWIKENDLYHDQVQSLEMNYDDSDRIFNNKLSKEAKQLPPEKNGIIFFRVNSLFFSTDGWKRIIPMIQKGLVKYPNVVGVVLFSFQNFINDTGIYTLDGGFICLKPVDRHTTRYTLFAVNRQCDLKIANSTLDRLFRMCNE